MAASESNSTTASSSTSQHTAMESHTATGTGSPATTGSAQRPGVRPSELPEPSVQLTEGWHCSHIFYRFNRSELSRMTAEQRATGREQLAAVLDPQNADAPKRLQTFIISGHKADFGVILFDADPLRVDSVHQSVLAGPLGDRKSVV